MSIRIVTIVIAALDALAAGGIALGSYYSTSDNATIGFDYAAGVIVAGLFALSGLPALILAGGGRALRAALALALAFPRLFAALFVVTVIFFSTLRCRVFSQSG
jgi:hypothetical protein